MSDYITTLECKQCPYQIAYKAKIQINCNRNYSLPINQCLCITMVLCNMGLTIKGNTVNSCIHIFLTWLDLIILCAVSQSPIERLGVLAVSQLRPPGMAVF